MFERAPSLQRLQTLDKVEQFVDMLNRYGCSEVQIAKIMMRQPQIIGTSAERIFEPKIELLEGFGFQGETLAKLLASNPSILGISLENDLLPKMGGTELFGLLRIYPSILQRSSLTPAQVDLIREIGGDKESKAYKFIVGEVATSRIETLKAKIENLKLCGLTAEETWQVCRAAPIVLRYSKKFGKDY
ncbi:hypothetical protein SUGI_1014800 [Cryptomeria japonica]|nr:hypothetical protein SUGI_1014800 [Cryptomeria japonica]